jgi:hypothetical protein
MGEMMSKYKIDKGVPIPPRKSANAKYPFREMEVGDSFHVAGNSQLLLKRMRSACSWAQSKYPETKYTVRTTDTGVRVWRKA